MKNIYLFGECMVELRKTSANSMHQSFAGDVFNTAVYLKRTFANTGVNLVTAVGKDQFSHEMRDYFASENINCDLVFSSATKIPGLYSIQLDEHGERSFTYWRENSAARDVMQFIDADTVEQFSADDVFFFSGISLAVIHPQDRAQFWTFIRQLKSKQVQIVFDPNYRARMWQSPAHAKQQFELALEHADVALPGVDDFEQLYGLTTAEQVYDFCQKYDIGELIIKNGEAGILAYVDNKLSKFAIEPVKNVVDTTSAGDSFNGVYLGARMQNLDANKAMQMASAAAGFVIQHKGAIVPSELFQPFVEKELQV
ncbi:sugar kinase [Thalassotalea sp. PLHSN55]|uniref:sugar kinase n=1 Tax=Thalassotalea sp. PLHSN55 TaxID=3435888 RepID=UPI003F8715B6